VEVEVEAETEAEVEATATLAAAVSALTAADLEQLASAAEKLTSDSSWVYARMRSASATCPNRPMSRQVFARHHSARRRHRARHHRNRQMISPKIYTVCRARCVKAFFEVGHIADYLHTSIYRLMTPARVDPFYHVTFGKCHLLESKRARTHCRRLRMLRKALHHHRRLLRDLEAPNTPHFGVEGGHHHHRRKGSKRLYRAICAFQKELPHIAKSLATLQEDISRLSKRLTGVSYEGPQATAHTTEGEMANIRTHTDHSTEGNSPAHKSAANLAHLRTIVERLRERVPIMARRFRSMKRDLKRIRRHLRRLNGHHHHHGGRRHHGVRRFGSHGGHHSGSLHHFDAHHFEPMYYN